MKSTENPMIPRIFPFLLFIAFIAVMDGFRFLAARGVISFSEQTFYCLYPIRSFAVLFLLLLFFPRYNEIDLRDVTQIGRTAASILIGLIVFILWIHMDWNLVNAPDAKVFNPDILSEGFTRATFVILRMFGLVVIVPVMEEIFWRSFLIRYIIDHDFMRVPMGRFTWPSFIISTILFGLEHHLILAGMMAGAAYNILLYRTKSIAQCIIAHAVTNLALGIYILCTGKWHFW